MGLATSRLHPLFGVEIHDLDVKRVDAATFEAVVDAFNDHSVLLFRRQSLTDDEQIAFSRRFGPLEVTIRSINSQARTLPEIVRGTLTPRWYSSMMLTADSAVSGPWNS